MQILPLKNPIQNYAWGSHRAIAGLLGRPVPSAEPEAELWMGAHPKAVSLARRGTEWLSLADVIQENPHSVLGERVVAELGPQLPFLFKILAAEEPLSIQAHPTREQAQAGFARESSLGVPLGAPHRNYRDENHKPEILCARSEFWVMAGFRPRLQLLEWLDPSLGADVFGLLEPLERTGSQGGTRLFFQRLLDLTGADRAKVAESVLRLGRDYVPREELRWAAALQERFPNDAGVLAPLFLNLLKLEPDEAIYLPAGQLHAYLEGTGVELMANSDNVLRGGLTTKHIAPEELLAILSSDEQAPRIILPEPKAPGLFTYRTPAQEFQLTRIDLDPEQPFLRPRGSAVEILVCLEGEATYRGPGLTEGVIGKGSSVLVPAAAPAYRLEGQAQVFRATVPTVPCQESQGPREGTHCGAS